MYIINIIKCNIYIYNCMYYLYMIFIYWISMVILMEYTSDIPSMEDHPTVHFLWLKLLYLRGHWCWKTIGINRCLDKNVTAISHLVGGLEPWNFMTFHSVGNVIIPTDYFFCRGWNHQPAYIIYTYYVYSPNWYVDPGKIRPLTLKISLVDVSPNCWKVIFQSQSHGVAARAAVGWTMWRRMVPRRGVQMRAAKRNRFFWFSINRWITPDIPKISL
jgi:hypothetical protein